MTEYIEKILIVDDARDIREPLAQYLSKQGFRTVLAFDASEARNVLADARIDLVILDIMMPGEDGLSLCRWLVAQNGPPVIFLTAMVDEVDRIVGLELGADDYIIKPFNPRELLARVRAILRRVPTNPIPLPSQQRSFAGWRHDPDRMILSNPSREELSLTSAENKLLGVFLDRPRDVLSRATLLELTAGREAKAYDRAIDNQISRLRRKIEENPQAPQILITEWGGGYRLVADVTTVEPS